MLVDWFDLNKKEVERERIFIQMHDPDYPQENFQKGIKLDAVKIRYPEMFFGWFMKKKGYEVFRMSVLPEEKHALFGAIGKFIPEKQVYLLFEKGMPYFFV